MNHSNLSESYLEILEIFCKEVGHTDLKAQELFRRLNHKFSLYEYVGGDEHYIGDLFDYYKNTVVPHKVEVYKAGIQIKDAFELTEYDVIDQLLIHDLSKFSFAEVGYHEVDFSNFSDNSPRVKRAFKRSWHHHKMNNKHHPEYWFDVGKGGETEVLEMPVRYLAEMVADWMGAGATYGSNVREWLPDNLQRFRFHEDSIPKLQYILSRYLNVKTNSAIKGFLHVVK